MTASDQEKRRELEAVGLRLQDLGYRFDWRPFFGTPGIWAFLPPEPDPSGITVVNRPVFLYGTARGWEARLTPHGGPHWIRPAATVAALEEIALEALRSTATPPSYAWHVEHG